MTEILVGTKKGLFALERAQQIVDRRARDRVFRAISGEPLQRPAQPHNRHRREAT